MNQSSDNLEDFFQQSFNDEEKVNHAADWNSPSEAVWENIQDGLTEERRLSVLFFHWPWSAIAASYLLIVGGYQFFQTNKENNLVNQSIVVEQLQPTTLAARTEVLCTDDPARMTQSNRFRSRDKNTEKLKNQQLKSSIRNVQALPGGVNDFYLQDFDNQIVVEGIKQFASKEITVQRPFSIPTIKSEIATTARSLSPINLELPKEKRSKNYLAVSYAPVVERLTENSGRYTQDNLAKGSNVALQIGRENEQGWAIETGIQYTKMEERGGSSTGIEGWKIAPTNYLEVPVSVKKKWKVGQLGVSVKAGVVNRFEINQMVMSNGDVIDDERNLRPNKYLPSVIAGVGLEYHVQPNISVFVEPTISKGIRPIVDFEGTELTAENLMVQVGVRYEL